HRAYGSCLLPRNITYNLKAPENAWKGINTTGNIAVSPVNIFQNPEYFDRGLLSEREVRSAGTYKALLKPVSTPKLGCVYYHYSHRLASHLAQLVSHITTLNSRLTYVQGNTFKHQCNAALSLE